MRSILRKDRNWLLRGLIILSVGIHALLLIRIVEVYRSEAVTSIELTLQDVSRPAERRIPRPPSRVKSPPLSKETERLNVSERRVPSMKPLTNEPVKTPSPLGPVEAVDAPGAPGVTAPSIAAWRPEETGVGPPAPLVTRDSYFELIRLAIERNKKYPEAARAARIEGRVTVGFVITPEGNIEDVKIVRRSGSRSLDEAALNAVKEAAPFPKPPKTLFKGPVKLAIAMVFELT